MPAVENQAFEFGFKSCRAGYPLTFLCEILAVDCHAEGGYTMKFRTRIRRANQWLRWAALPPPWWIFLGAVAALSAVILCSTASPWGPAIAVAYQIAGAALAVAQFVSLQQGLSRGWLTREVLEWWSKRPVKRPPITATLTAALAGSTVRGYASVTKPAKGTTEEQLREIWQRLSTTDSMLSKLGDDIRLQMEHSEKQLGALRGEAQSFAAATEQRLSETLTSAPLQAAIGFWLILLGLSMQLWHAWP